MSSCLLILAIILFIHGLKSCNAIGLLIFAKKLVRSGFFLRGRSLKDPGKCKYTRNGKKCCIVIYSHKELQYLHNEF
jgi:hypothetical protein